jgi:hypothetical protein
MRRPDTPYRARLSATELRDLFRAPVGAFGKPWADALPPDAAPGVTAAMKAVRARDWPAALTAALAAGEGALARQAVLGFLNESPQGLLAFDAAAPLPADLRPMLWVAAVSLAGRAESDPDVRRVMAEIAAAPDGLALRVATAALPDAAEAGTQAAALGSLLRTGHAMPPPDFGTLVEAAALIAAAPEGRTLAALCTDACPADRDGCIVAGNSAARGYFTLFALDTPLATVIPHDRYRGSPRARSELLRMAMGSGALLSMLPPTPGGACFAALVPQE